MENSHLNWELLGVIKWGVFHWGNYLLQVLYLYYFLISIPFAGFFEMIIVLMPRLNSSSPMDHFLRCPRAFSYSFCFYFMLLRILFRMALITMQLLNDSARTGVAHLTRSPTKKWKDYKRVNKAMFTPTLKRGRRFLCWAGQGAVRSGATSEVHIESSGQEMGAVHR